MGGVLDKTSPIEICKKEGDEYVVIRTYYVNNLPPSITYDGKAVYWDLTKEDDTILSEDIALRFDVVDVNHNRGNVEETE